VNQIQEKKRHPADLLLTVLYPIETPEMMDSRNPKNGGMHESNIDESNTEHQDGTQAKPGDYKSTKLNQYDVVIRKKPSQYGNDAAENKIGSSATKN